jgi:uncharacterized membrane protein
MLMGALTFSAPQWLWPAAAAIALAVAVLWWSYRSGLSGWLRWLCAALKSLGIAALAFCLLEPLWSGQRARPGANLFAVVADNSQGLQIKDAGETRSRGEVLRALLDPSTGGWQPALEESFEVRRFAFDARLQGVKDFGELDFNGRASAIGVALRGLKERFTDRPLAGVLLLTDGNATDLRGSPLDLTGLPPVYPVVIGRADAIRDLAVAQVNVSQTAFEDAPVTVQADVTTLAFNGESVVAQLRDATGRTVEEQTLRARRDDETLAFRFRFRPERPGLSFYELRVAAREEAGASTNTVPSREATLLNNRRVVAVDRGHGPYRILYVAGRPNWEYKFLNRALQEDDQVQLVGLIRIALREPKFDFRGRAGETGNPLFRGFGDQSREEVERYDKPVLTRLNTRDELELRGGFPGTPEELYSYHAVILDDLEAAFFTPDQLSLLQRYVSERGGGFLMLGGMESFKEGQYQRTPVGDMLPVYLDRAPAPGATQNWRLNLSREGWIQTWARLRDNEAEEKSRLDRMPPFQVLNPPGEAKPAATVVATVADEGGRSVPALVTQRFGRGRTAALLIGDFWRWGMQNPDARRDMDKAWRQLARWLVADVPERVELTVAEAPENAAGVTRLQVRVRDEKFQPTDDAAVTIEVQPALTGTDGGATNAVRLRAEPAGAEAGLYEVEYVPRAVGGFHATASVTNAVGALVARAELGWSTDPVSEEFRSLKPNVALLEDLARRSGGQLLEPGQLERFVRGLPQRQAPVMEAWTRPAWHTPWLFLLALACFVAEWGIRRRNGMP